MNSRFRESAILILLGLWSNACVPWTVRPIESETDAAAGAAVAAPAAYVESIWASELVPAVLNAAVDARVLLDALAASPKEVPARYGHSVVGGPAYYIVKGRGIVVSVDTSSRNGLAMVDVAPFDRRPDLSIQIGPVLLGSSLRDATGIVRFSDFVNQLQFADVANELNERVLKTVLAPLDKARLPGNAITFAGTLGSDSNTDPPLRGLIPVQLIWEGSP
jgi:predicted lipoprotein